MTNKLKELKKELLKANEAYQTAERALYIYELNLFNKNIDNYYEFYTDKERVVLKISYDKARNNLEAANTAYDIEETKQKQRKRLLYLECEIKKFTKYKTKYKANLTLEELENESKLEELENEMREIHEVYNKELNKNNDK